MTTIAQVADVVDRAAFDPAFRQQLLSAPAKTLQEAGIEVPDGLEVRVVENTDTLRHLVLPPRPEGVSGDDLRPDGSTSGSTGSTAEQVHAHARLVVESWSDGDLRARLLDDPVSVLAERGITLPAGVGLRVVESSDRVVYLPLPPAASR